MHSHPNAHLTQKGRLRLVTQHLEHGRSHEELAAENGISLRCAYRWLARYRSGGPASLTVVSLQFRQRSSSARRC
jgi:transposase